MDWARAIAINQSALTRIVAALIAMAGLVGEGVGLRLARPTYRAVLQVLRPAEAAVRRLIVIAARGLTVEPQPSRPMPKGLKFAGRRSGQMAFQLFDTRKRFAFDRRQRIPDHKAPRVWMAYDTSRLSPLFRPPPEPRHAPPKDDTVDASRLGRRLAAIKLALETLPAQAKRLVRWQAKRKAMKNPKFTSPLRIGHPPGHRKNPRNEVDWVLKECHALARDVEREDTS